jgi:phosphohistidine phosphatase
MKQLFLIRHAKSDWENAELTDIERHLNARGYSNANAMSLKFKTKPDLIITSPAIRAISTALIFAKNLNYNANTILIKQELYDSTINDYLGVIKNIDDKFNTVLLFAHNPVISNVAQLLTQELPAEMPTCAMAGITFNTSHWKSIVTGKLSLFDYPKK